MTIIAKWPILVGDDLYPAGAIVEGLAEEEEERLVSKQLASYQINHVASKQPNKTPSTRPETLVDALVALLEKMKKPELVVYGVAAEVPGVDESQKVDQLRKAIFADAKENGVDLDALTDEQLCELVQLAGIESDALERDELIAAIDGHFGTAEDEQL